MIVINIPVEPLRTYLESTFIAWGATPAEATDVVDHLVESSLTGHDSHGVLRAPWYIEKILSGDLVPNAPIEVENETPTTAIVNGNWGFGQPACRHAINLCIEKAAAQNIACVTVRQINHMGRVGYYTGMASEKGMVGMGCANLHGSSHCVAPFGGIDRRLPTNPLSISYPSGSGTPFLADMTTSVIAEGKLQMRRNQGGAAENGWIIDNLGEPTNDPWTFYKEPKGALLPMGGIVSHKGFALSMAVEGLAGALSNAQCSNPAGTRHGNACWFTVIKIEAFVPQEAFTDNIRRLNDHVKSSRPAPGSDGVKMPGEPEQEQKAKRLTSGIPIDPITWERLAQLASEKNVRYSGHIHQAE